MGRLFLVLRLWGVGRLLILWLRLGRCWRSVNIKQGEHGRGLRKVGRSCNVLIPLDQFFESSVIDGLHLLKKQVQLTNHFLLVPCSPGNLPGTEFILLYKLDQVDDTPIDTESPPGAPYDLLSS